MSSPAAADTALKTAKDRAVAILIDSDVALQESLTELQRARELAGKAGLSVESHIVKPIETTTTDSAGGSSSSNSNSNNNNSTVHICNTTTTTTGSNAANCYPPTDSNNTTGGHSNTDHVVASTGDDRLDRIAELKRNLLRRHRAMQPEQRREERWDKPRAFGERRRRINREQDINENYPNEPPFTGWSVFVGQMTTKIRHDRPDERHDQSKGE
jgi:hypothetical protein